MTVYGITVCLVVAALASWSMYASAKEAALSAGRQLAGLSDLTEGAETYWMNGERFHHVSTVVDLSVGEVLDRFEKHCTDSPSALGQVLSGIPDSAFALAKISPPPGPIRNGLIRADDGKGGMVICFVDDKRADLVEFARRAERFSKTLNLAEFGHLRYAFAETRGEKKTRLVALWADTDLNVSAMFPESGDAAGTDPRALPRPPTSRRTLSAFAEGLGYGLFVYDCDLRPEDARKFYDDWAKKNGWQVVEPISDPETARAYLRPDGFQAFLAVGEHQGHTYVSLTEAGGRMVSIQANLESGG